MQIPTMKKFLIYTIFFLLSAQISFTISTTELAQLMEQCTNNNYESGSVAFNGVTVAPYIASTITSSVVNTPESPPASNTQSTVTPMKFHKQRIMKLPKEEQLHAAFFQLVTEYDNDLTKICNEAFQWFAQQTPAESDIIIFDKDETLLSTPAHLFRRLQRAMTHRSFDKCNCCLVANNDQIVLEPVRDLWQNVRRLGYKTAIITADKQTAKDEQCQLLIEVGYELPPDDLILFSSDIEKASMVTVEGLGKYKNDHRKKLSEKLTIAGNVGDTETDFSGGNNGYEVHVPNFINYIADYHNA